MKEKHDFPPEWSDTTSYQYIDELSFTFVFRMILNKSFTQNP